MKTDDQILEVINGQSGCTAIYASGDITLYDPVEDSPLITFCFHNEMREKLTKDERLRLVNLMLARVFIP